MKSSEGFLEKIGNAKSFMVMSFKIKLGNKLNDDEKGAA